MIVDVAYGAVALVGAGLALSLLRSKRRSRVSTGLAVLLLLGALLPAASATWIALGRLRSPPLAGVVYQRPGVTIQRDVLSAPRPVVLYWVSIDLGHPELRFHVTPPDYPDGRLRARTTLEFASEHDVAVAINVGFFYPIHETFVWWTYPRPADPVTAVGQHCSGGTCYGMAWHRARVLFNENPKTGLVDVSTGTHALAPHAVAGQKFLFGPQSGPGASKFDKQAYPRTILGLRPQSEDESGPSLVWLIVDGKQPGYSEGLTLAEVETKLLARGVTWALELDGGGSATLVARDPNGRLRVVNSPCHTKVPGRQRPVANHLGLRLPD